MVKATGAATAGGQRIHRLKITLHGTQPPIWRRVEVDSECTLGQLHYVIQAAFGWEDEHLWVFETRAGEFGVPHPEVRHRDAGSQQLSGVARRTGSRFSYTYDLGDCWQHDIVVEAVTEREPDVTYPRCMAGRRACPPEDCGGVWGYGWLMEVLADPGHEEHADRLDWMGLDTADQFDPAAFDVAEVNGVLAKMSGRGPRG
ncbi:plasmid pRiA4b ORF-3 family protein [Flexivirga caeni]|uniref:Plasmid pRiA4b ORF-3 family protein n=1 Tax=Flexivirga caeni TaxID=2294115 RepID=A0A3M9MFD9_9MICO|nr:plasmid pRiA4b ORF-3 family protein [Flexivirga caeni]RNI24256.1 plasmid pRiA4b ORF-3 family protein [Flexivirga caeni]